MTASNLSLDIRGREAVASTAPLATMRLLHVEDNAADALLTQEYIRSVLPGVEFDTAARLGDLTVERAAAADCAILDLSLPDASGLEALIAVRAMSDDLPIIVLTGFDDLQLALTALRHGAEDYLIKNHADGYTLERAIRYSVERRRLGMELVQESAAATVATATSIAAEAALDAEIQRSIEGPAQAGAMARPPASMTLGTHEVSVRIDEKTGDYALRCQSCDWESDQDSGDGHSWAERSLDWVLLYHVDFGGLAHDAEGKLPPSVRAALRAARAEQSAGPAPARPARTSPPVKPVTRRGVFKPGRWMQAPTPAATIPGLASYDGERAAPAAPMSAHDAKLAHPAGQ